MLNSVDFSGRPFHFIGIGGIGMSALAYILAKRQLPVSGSDIRSSHITQRLQESGAHIFGSQDPTNFDFFQSQSNFPNETVLEKSSCLLSTGGQGATSSTRKETNRVNRQQTWFGLPQVICSTAIQTANAEYQAAQDLGCPIFHRAELLAALSQDYHHSILVAGTHGKTTTSSLMGYLLLQANLDPTIVVGGEVNAWEGNARLGHSSYLVAEADESDGSLVKLAAEIGVITNIELDHPDHYDNLEEVIATFQVFAKRCKKVVACIDCATVRDRLPATVTYSLDWSLGADYTVDHVVYQSDGTTADIWERGKKLGQLKLKLLGKHNLNNALAVVAVGRLLELEFATITKAIATFPGARRRFEYRGEANGILFIDDYAHHPSEIRATLAAARLQAGKRRVVAIFQPHRYSRTLAFLAEFAESFNDADVVILTDIYGAGEQNLQQISGQTIANLIADRFHPRVSYQPSLQSVATLLKTTLLPGDLALFLGAGNINQIIPEVIAFYEKAVPIQVGG